MAPSPASIAVPSMQARYVAAATTVVLIVALLVMASWLLREPRLIPGGGYRMVFNTALCFALAAGSLLLNISRRRAQIQTTAGTAIFLLAGLVLLQHVTGYRLGVDWAGLHEWIDSSNPRPGRMAPATCVALMLSGACLVAVHHAKQAIAPYLARGLAAVVMAIGILSLIGLLLQLNVMFDVYVFRDVSFPAATCFIVLGSVLWLSTPWPAYARLSDDNRIVYTGAAVLVIFGLVLGLASLAALKEYAEDRLGDSFLREAQGHAALFLTVIDDSISDVDGVATRPTVAGFLQEIRRQRDTAGKRDSLRQIAASLLPQGYSAIAFRDPSGALLAAAGELLSGDNDPLFTLKRPHNARVYWSRGFILHAEAVIRDTSGTLGTVIVQQPLTVLTAQAFDTDALGDTGEIAICAADDRLLYCSPQRLRRAAYDMPRRTGSVSLAMDRAIDGLSGTLVAQDYRRQQVLAAHTPIGDLGLGMVMKMDTAELYQPLRRQLALISLLMLLMIIAGVFALRLAVKPLASQLRANESRLRMALHASRRALWDWDTRSGRIYLSEEWQALLGGETQPMETTIVGLRKQVHPDDGQRLDLHLRDVLSGKTALYDIDHRVRTPDGRWLWIRSRGEVIERDATGRALRMTGTNSDISSRVQMQEKLAYQATHDTLTGMPNRSLFRDRLNQAIARSRRGGILMAVMYLDIDKFKGINDTLGHDAGDDLLVAFSQRLATCVRATDTVARLGGDEYAVILETLSAREDGERIAEKIVVSMRPEFKLGSRQLAITTSVGLAFYDGREEIGQDALVKQADEALYRAKGAGRNNYQVFDSEAKVERRKAEGKNT